MEGKHVKNKDKKQPSDAPQTENDFQIERKEAYLERSTQNLLRSLINSDKNQEILPKYNPTSGFVYNSIEPAFEEEISHEKAAEFLERLTRLDILKKSFFDTVSTCPQCGSTTMTLHYHCPNCKSHNIIKTKSKHYFAHQMKKGMF